MSNLKRREWDILKCSNNGDRFIHGDDTNDNEFVRVREVLPFDNSLMESYSEMLKVIKHARKLSLKHDDFKLYAMEPLDSAIQKAEQVLGGGK